MNSPIPLRLLLVAVVPLAAVCAACAAPQPTEDERVLASLQPTVQTIGSYSTPIWYPEPPPVGARSSDIVAAGRSQEVATVSEAVGLARDGACTRLQAILDDVYARAHRHLQAGAPRGARTVLLGTPDDTAAAMDTVGWSTIDGPTTGAASWDPQATPGTQPRLTLPEPRITRWAVSAPGVNNHRRVFCQLRLARAALDEVVSQALRREWQRVNGSPPDAMDVVRIRQAIADAWRDHRQPE